MILLDANLLIYAHRDAMSQNRAALAWLDGSLAGGTRVGIPWPTLTAFIRLVTNSRVFSSPDSLPEAWAAARHWLALPNVWIPHTTDAHEQIFHGLVATPGLGSNDVPDAHLAALAIEHGLVLHTADSGFARFPGLRWINPLAPTRARRRRRNQGH